MVTDSRAKDDDRVPGDGVGALGGDPRVALERGQALAHVPLQALRRLGAGGVVQRVQLAAEGVEHLPSH